MNRANKTKDQQRIQLLEYKNELFALSKKKKVLQAELKKKGTLNESLKKELDSVKKELQFMKRAAVRQRAEQEKLKGRLDQMSKDRDSLNATWQSCKAEISVLCDKITNQQASLSKKDLQCKEQIKQINFLKVKNQYLEKEIGMKENDADHRMLELRKCSEELKRERCKLEETRAMHAIGPKLGEKLLLIKNAPHPPLVGKPHNLQRIDSLQKELQTQTEERVKAQRLCEELKQVQSQLSDQLQQCQTKLRHQAENHKVVKIERDIFKCQVDKLKIELGNMKMLHYSEKQYNGVWERTNRVMIPSGTSSQIYNPPARDTRMSCFFPSVSEKYNMNQHGSALKTEGIKLHGSSMRTEWKKL